MKRKRFSILFFIKKTRLLSNGEAPIRLRITYDGQYIETQIRRSLPPEQWSQAKEKSIGKDRSSLELNSYLDVIRVKLYHIQQDMELRDETLNPKIIRDRFLGIDEKSNKTLYSVFKEHNERCRQLIGTDYSDITVRRYDNCLKYLMEVVEKYHNQKDLPLKDLNA